MRAMAHEEERSRAIKQAQEERLKAHDESNAMTREDQHSHAAQKVVCEYVVFFLCVVLFVVCCLGFVFL